jgi:hypothetical protein
VVKVAGMLRLLSWFGGAASTGPRTKASRRWPESAGFVDQVNRFIHSVALTQDGQELVD